MTDQEPSEATGEDRDALRQEVDGLLKAAIGAVRGTDTFQWLTTDVARGLEARNAPRRVMLTTWKHEVDARTGDVWENTQRKRVVERAMAELDMQASLAKVLRGLGGAGRGES